jgi:hypothetical protein
MKLKVGDVISVGPHPSVPACLVGKFFAVKAVNGIYDSIELGPPHNDPELKEPYRWGYRQAKAGKAAKKK